MKVWPGNSGVLLLLLGLVSLPVFASTHDRTPPGVWMTEPADQDDEVNAVTPVYVYITDPAPDASGINPSSLSMKVDGESVDIEIYYQPNHNIWVGYYTEEPFHNGAVNVGIDGCDNAGNCMESYQFTFFVNTHADQDHLPPWVFSPYPTADAENVNPDTEVFFYITDSYEHVAPEQSSGLDPNSVTVLINGRVTAVTLEPIQWFWLVTTAPEPPLPSQQTVTVEVNACDLVGNCMNAYSWSFTTSSRDSTPPHVTYMFPTDGATGVSVQTTISAVIQDDLNAVDGDSIELYINQELINSIVKSAEGNGFRIAYCPLGGWNRSTDYAIEIRSCDTVGNCGAAAWHFTTEAALLPPQLLYPHNDSWLNYHLEDGIISFSWTCGEATSYFRMKVFIEGVSIPSVIDIGPGNYTLAVNVATLGYHVSEASWDVLSKIGSIQWQVALVDSLTGNEMSDYSKRFTFVLAPTDCVILRDPQDFSSISSQQPPTFSWDSDPNAVRYFVGFARQGEDGQLFDNITTGELPYFLTEIPMSQSTWDVFPAGFWLWTIIAEYADGSSSNFMLFHFTKTAS